MRTTSKIIRTEVASLVPAQTIAQGIKRIKETFPEDPVTACAIAHGEGFLSNGINNNPKTKDHSVGWFQINLLAHASRVPGATMTDKENWLLNPTNNLKFAREVFERRGKNWSAWGAFTNKSFKKHLERCI